MFVTKGGIRSVSYEGQGLVEYALILVLVAVVVIVIVGLLGQQIQNVFCDILLQMGDVAPQVQACEAPRVTCLGAGNGATVSGGVPFEADVQDSDGPATIVEVRFFIDGVLYTTENHYRYCMAADPGGGAPCYNFNTNTLTPGSHTIRMVATDVDGNTGECSVTFTRS